jgi:hypothetical protein
MGVAGAVMEADTESGSVEGLEAEICAFAGNLAAATARFVLLVAEYDRKRGWERWGCRSCVGWLSWKCGMGAHAARERLRVGHALARLAIVRGEFEVGRLSYSQVRAITRIAGPHNESILVDIARHGTAQQLERLVAGTVLAEKLQAADFAESQFDARRFVSSWDALSMWVGRLVLTPDDGEVFVKALAAAAEQLRVERGEASPESSREQLWADAAVLMAESFLASGAAARSGTDAYRVVVNADQDAETDTDTDTETGADADADAEPHAEADANPDADGVWRGRVAGGAGLSSAVIGRIWCDTAVTRVVVRDGVMVGEPVASKSIPAGVRRALGVRDRQQCRFPGCHCRRVDAHHIRHRRHGGGHSLDNLVSLCRFHHRLVHEKGFRMVREPGGRLRFYAPDGRELSGDCGLADHTSHPGRLSELNEAAGVRIEPDTISPTWYGDRLDLHYTVPLVMDPRRPRGDAYSTN